ncbi:bifunctional 4-hydroxy-2-oxoglutarate aldolase/2-dehydro-3-deoxy-phosphogluconate aldolase [bacterium]|nr:bifunctional 4-hydroxy-2-oxoglutarate aldolase/2-dehydro-3-deoxy-phosphogluconate aldolase [bacterium]
MRQRLLASIERTRLFGVIRAKDATEAVWAAQAAIEGGLELLEITLTTPGALDAIRTLSESGALVGAGTVLTRDDAHAAIKAGAAFVVSPHTDAAVVAACREAGVWVAPGAATPTELLAAHRLGADCVKVFPAEALGGPRYLKLVRDPLPFLPLMPTGGVDASNLAAYLAAGAVAAGVATCLFDREAVARRDAGELARRAAELLAIARS